MATLKYGHIRARYDLYEEDGPDLDDLPDLTDGIGTVTLTPHTTHPAYDTNDGDSRGVINLPIRGAKILNGALRDRQGNEGVKIIREIDGTPVYWTATVTMAEQDKTPLFKVNYQITEWPETVEGETPSINLHGMVSDFGKRPAAMQDAVIGAQEARDQAVTAVGQIGTSLAEAEGWATAAEGYAQDATQDLDALNQAVVDATSQVGLAAAEADRAIGLSTAQDEHVAGVLEDDTSLTHAAFKAVGNATYERLRSYSANAYGASPVASRETNRGAFQAAVDAAHAAGGGAVVAVPGTYLVKGIVQKSNVSFQGPYTLRHPDGQTGHVIAGQLFSATGSIAAGSRTLTLTAAAPDLAVGSVVAIRGAGGMSESAISTLTAQLVPGDTSITLSSQASLFGGGSFLIAGSEIIQYTAASGGVLSGVTRGALGTQAGTHASGAWIGQSIRLYARVEKIDGTTATLDRPAKVGVSGAAIQFGIVRPAIVGGVEFEGQRPPGGASANPYPVSWETVGGGTIDVLNVERAESALDLRHGTMDCTIGAINAHECGNAPVSGSAVWLFRGCEDNHLGSVKAHGEDTYTGIYMDDRTSTSTEWDAPCVGNTVDVLDVRRPWVSGNPTTGIGVNITNGSRNYISHIRTHGVRTPIAINGLSQVYRPDSAPTPTWSRNNRIGGGVVTAAYQPWAISAPDVVIANLYWETVSPSSGYADFPVRLVNTGTASGQPPAATTPKFPDGTSPAPGIAFENDPDTGFRRMTSGDVAYISDGALRFRMRPTGLLMNDGYGIEMSQGSGGMIGTGFGQKIGFWGATPTVKPGAIADATDAGSAQARLNDLLAALRTIGIIAT